MSYKENINKIDSQIRNIFSDVKIDSSDYRQLNIRTSNPLNENFNKNLEMQIFVNQKNINEEDPILEWGYYTDSNKLDNTIKFVTSISNMKDTIENIIKENRLNKEYLKEIAEVEMIYESSENKPVDHINETYKLSENHLKIDGLKLKTYFDEKYGLVIEDLGLVYFDVMSGKLRGQYMSDDPIMGDEAVLEAKSISSKSYNGNITPKQWVDIEKDLRKLPFVEDVNSNTHSSKLDVNFSTKIFVEIN